MVERRTQEDSPREGPMQPFLAPTVDGKSANDELPEAGGHIRDNTFRLEPARSDPPHSGGFYGLPAISFICDDNHARPHPDLVRSVLDREKPTESSSLSLPVELPGRQTTKRGGDSLGASSLLQGSTASDGHHHKQEVSNERLEKFAKLPKSRAQLNPRRRATVFDEVQRRDRVNSEIKESLSASFVGSDWGELSSHWGSGSLETSFLWEGLQPMNPMPTMFPYFEASGVGMPGHGSSTVKSIASTVRSNGSSLRTRSGDIILWGRNA